MSNDPTDPIKIQAGQYSGVDEGAACTQTSFKSGKKAFLYIGEQGGRYKAMFKLKNSIDEADALSQKEPKNYEIGKHGWVTARFTAEDPMPQALWERWLDESYQLSLKK
ncbi:MAG: MmcQ/YjbR family DNA-binding protein [Chloroflexota bacterium]